MYSELPVITEQDAVPALVSYLREKRLDRLTLVADANTYAALGERVDQALAAVGGFDVKRILLAGDEITPDETTCMEVFLANGSDERTFLAVGSGVITDVTRFVSHRSRNAFICLPTAPSVDAYTATGSSLVLKRLKQLTEVVAIENEEASRTQGIAHTTENQIKLLVGGPVLQRGPQAEHRVVA